MCMSARQHVQLARHFPSKNRPHDDPIKRNAERDARNSTYYILYNMYFARVAARVSRVICAKVDWPNLCSSALKRAQDQNVPRGLCKRASTQQTITSEKLESQSCVWCEVGACGGGVGELQFNGTERTDACTHSKGLQSNGRLQSLSLLLQRLMLHCVLRCVLLYIYRILVWRDI